MCKRFLIPITCLLALLPMLAGAQVHRPVIQVMVQAMEPIPGGLQPLTPAGVTQAAGAIIASRGYRWSPMYDGPLPAGSTVIRILYIVSERGQGATTTVAASAATQLLQVGNIGGGKLTMSVYSGVQQNISQDPNVQRARAQVYDLFVKELQERIHNALGHLEATIY